MYGNHRFDIVPPGIEMDKFKYSEENRRRIRELYNCENHFVLGVVGRLVSVKNYEFAIQVFARVKELCNECEVSMLIVGDGELRHMLEKYVDELGISQCVHFVGMTNKVSEYYSAMDCLLGTSFSEGLPLGIVEAQVSGLRCICADGNYPKEIAVTDLVEMLPLSVGSDVWALKVLTIQKEYGMKQRNSIQDTHLLEFGKTAVADRLAAYFA